MWNSFMKLGWVLHTKLGFGEQSFSLVKSQKNILRPGAINQHPASVGGWGDKGGSKWVFSKGLESSEVSAEEYLEELVIIGKESWIAIIKPPPKPSHKEKLKVH